MYTNGNLPPGVDDRKFPDTGEPRDWFDLTDEQRADLLDEFRRDDDYSDDFNTMLTADNTTAMLQACVLLRRQFREWLTRRDFGWELTEIEEANQ